jgi:hypothetical protein
MRLTFVVGSALVLTMAGMIVFQRQRTSGAQEQARAAEQARVQEQSVELAQAAAPQPVVVEANPLTPYGAAGGNRFQPAAYPPAADPPGFGGWSAGDPETIELGGQDQQLEQEVQSLVRQLADSGDDKQRAELKDKLAATLEKQFDTQQKLRELEVSRIEARVQKLRDVVRKRTDSRRKIIDNRFEQLLNDADGLGWNAATAQGVQYVPQGLPGMMGPMRPTMKRNAPGSVAPAPPLPTPKQN